MDADADANAAAKANADAEGSTKALHERCLGEYLDMLYQEIRIKRGLSNM